MVWLYTNTNDTEKNVIQIQQKHSKFISLHAG